MGTYVTSDLHLNHYNILKLEQYNLHLCGLDYIQTLDQYNNMIINNINLIVGPRDTLYILGDFGFGPCAELKQLLAKIRCHNIILLFGNHDHYNEAGALGMGFIKTIQEPYYLPEAKGKIILSHYPVYEAMNNPYIVYNLHGHLHGSKLDLPGYVNVNIAMNKYKPLSLDSFIKKALVCGKSREEKWLQEWYKNYQVFSDKNRKDIALDDKGKIITHEAA